jgi:menaquinol-cytochrome c reductase iron-sulfur subunit
MMEPPPIPKHPNNVSGSNAQDPARRDFLKKACAAGIGGAIVLVPAGAGLAVLLDPLRHKASGGERIFVTSLDSLPPNGLPQKFPILASRIDAWNKLPNAPVGAVYLRRTGENSVEALNVVCPHAGCFVDFRQDKKDYFCPCHNSSFSLDGKIADPKSPAPRGLDSLEVEIRNGKEVWVSFRNFQTGHSEKIPVA